MRLRKFGHACVRIEDESNAVVIDPGMFTDPEALEGATAVLITHQHFDHWDADLLAESNAPIFTIAAVAEQIKLELPEAVGRLTTVTPGSRFDVGFPVEAFGRDHAVIHPELPQVDNSGYLMWVDDETIFHPGDSLLVPEQNVDILCAPASAPWMKISEAIDFVRNVGAPINIGIHDRVYSEPGHDIVDRHMNTFLGKTGQEWVRLDDGEEL